jgi:hypothetical protein
MSVVFVSLPRDVPCFLELVLFSLCYCMQVHVSYEDLRVLIRDLDTDGSGSVSYRELVQFLHRAPSSPAAATARPRSLAAVMAELDEAVELRVAQGIRAAFDAAVSSRRLVHYEDVFVPMDRRRTGNVSDREFEVALLDLPVRNCTVACLVSLVKHLCTIVCVFA